MSASSRRFLPEFPEENPEVTPLRIYPGTKLGARSLWSQVMLGHGCLVCDNTQMVKILVTFIKAVSHQAPVSVFG
jgi:hypothetical protein